MPKNGLLVCLTLFLFGNGPAPTSSGQAAVPQEPTLSIGWAEINPLGLQGEPVLLEVKDQKTPIRWTGRSTGLALVCFGGDGFAVSCEQTYLEGSDPLLPVLQKGVGVTAVIRTGKTVAAGARVSLVPQPLRSRRREIYLPLGRAEKDGKAIREIVSDRTGRFTTPQLAAGDYVLQVQTRDGRLLQHDVRVPRPEAFRQGKPASAPPAAPLLDIGEITFPEGVNIQGWITSRDGRALRGATLHARQGEPLEPGRFFEASTNPEGKATLAGLDPTGPVRVTCEADGFVRFQEFYDVPPQVVNCVLAPLARVDGLVVDTEGEPVANATVSTRKWGRLAATGGDGRFALPELEPARYELVIAAPGFRVNREPVEIAPGESKTLRVELHPGQDVRGLLRDATDQEPVGGASIVSADPPGAVSTTSDAEGLFDFTTDDEGRLRLEISAEGYPKTPLEVDPARIAALAQEDEPLVVELKKGGHVHLIVWDEEEDRPCQGCAFDLIGPVSSDHLVTNARGEALSVPLAEGEYNVLKGQEQSRGVEVRVEGNVTKRVQVASGRTTPLRLGEPRPTVEIHFRPQVPAGWILLAEAGSEPRIAERLPAGGFKVKKPTDGPVTLRLHLENGSLSVDQAVLPADDTSPSIDLPLPQGVIRARLVTAEGAPAASRQVAIVSTASGTRRAATITGGDGSVLIPFLPAGAYALVVDGQAIQTFSLEEGADMDLGSVELPAAPGQGTRPRL